MQTNHLCVLIHIRTKGEIGTMYHETSLRPLVELFFTDRSKSGFLLWIVFVIYVSYLSCFLVSSLQPCGHLLGNGSFLGSLVYDVLLCFCHFPCGKGLDKHFLA